MVSAKKDLTRNIYITACANQQVVLYNHQIWDVIQTGTPTEQREKTNVASVESFPHAIIRHKNKVEGS